MQRHEPQHGQVVKIAYTYYTNTKKLAYDDEISDDLSSKYSVAEISCKKIISDTQDTAYRQLHPC